MAEARGLSGARLINGKWHARVSHISGYRVSNSKAKKQDALIKFREDWAREYSELPEDFYSQRGTLIHSHAEHFLLTGQEPGEIHPWVKPFWPYVKSVCGQIYDVKWAEKPVDLNLPWPPCGFLDDEGIHRWHIWHDDGYCGTPDLLCKFEGQLTLPDWKSSDTPYCKSFSKSNPNGFHKAKRTAIQLAGYMMAFEQRLNMPGLIQQGAIFNVVSGKLPAPYENKPRKANVEDQLVIIRYTRDELENKYWPLFQAQLEAWKTDRLIPYLEQNKRVPVNV
jgi:hypothetical protein